MKRRNAVATSILLFLLAPPVLGRAQGPSAESRTKAKQRAVGAVLLSVGAVMLPVSTAWFLTSGWSLCYDGCDAATEHRSSVALGAFAGWHAAANAVAFAGGAVLVAGQHDAEALGGSTHRRARTMRIVGGALVAASAIVLPIGVVGIDSDLGSPLSHDQERALGGGITALGSAMLTAGTVLTATGAYYDSRPAGPQLSIRPTSHPTAGQHASWDGAVATLSGSF